MRIVLIALISLGLISCGIAADPAQAPNESFGLSAQTVRTEPLPDDDQPFFQVREIKLHDLKELNYQTFDSLRAVVISGKKVVIGKGHVNHIYESYNNARDIKELKIYADELIIKEPFYLPQTNVTIYARRLQFTENTAAIITTPVSLTQIPGQFQDGKPGLQAGNVNVFVKELNGAQVTEGDQAFTGRFVLNGGNGQKGGAGQVGTDGANMEDVSAQSFCRRNQNGPSAVYFQTRVVGEKGQKRWPGDGGDAIPGGYPGDPGRGGVLTTNLEIVQGSLLPGNPGEATEVYRGGIAGKPWIASWEECVPRQLLSRVIEQHSSLPGKEAKGRQARVSKSERFGERKTVSEAAWLHPEVLNQVIAYIKASYLNLDLKTTQDLASRWMAEVDQRLNASEYPRELEVGKIELQSILDRMAMQLDYFGNPFGWVPMLSFEVSRTLFEDEIQRAMKILSLSEWIESAYSSQAEKVSALHALRQDVVEQVSSGEQKFNAAQEALPDLKAKAENLAVQYDYLSSYLAEMENRLEQRAKDNAADAQKLPLWKKLLKSAALVAKVVPVYQPALAAIGTGMEMLTEVNLKKPWKDLNQISGYAKQVSHVDWKESERSWKEFKEKVSFNDFSEKNTKEKAKYLEEMVAALKPVYEGIKQARQLYKDKEVPQSAIEAELAKLKAENAEFKEVAAKVEQYLQEQKMFSELVNETMKTLSALSIEMTKGYSSITVLDRQLSDGYQHLDEGVLHLLRQMKRDAEDRLLQYHYNLAVAYEYRTLQTYPGRLNLQDIYERVRKVVLEEKKGPLSPEDIKKLLIPIYEDQLAKVAKGLVDLLNNSQPEKTNRATLTLPPFLLSELNRDGQLVFSLNDKGLFGKNEEQIRIKHIRIKKAELDYAAADVAELFSASVKVGMTHLGRSTLMRGQEEFHFSHFNRSGSGRHSWETSYDLMDLDGEGKPAAHEITISVAQNSLLKSLLSSMGYPSADQDIMYYTQPGAIGQYRISKEVTVDGLRVDLKSITFEVEYDYRVKAI